LQLINPSTLPNELNTTLTPHSMIHGDACFAYFNKMGIPLSTSDGHTRHDRRLDVSAGLKIKIDCRRAWSFGRGHS
jgi:hypothetical protein